MLVLPGTKLINLRE